MNKNVHLKIKRQKNKLFSSFIFLLSVTLCVDSNNVLASSGSNVTLEQIMQQKKISLKAQNKTAKFILSEIEKSTGIGYVIKDDNNDPALKNLSINVSNVTVEQALKTLFANTGFSYKIDGNIIVIAKIKAVVSENRNATTINVKGKVTSTDERQPVVGATLIVLGTSNGAITSDNGEFLLTLKKGDSVEVSFMGYESQVVKVENENDLIISLRKDVMHLDEVVVTGYNRVKRSSYTGNAVTVTRDQLMKASKSNVISALQSFDPSFRIKENNQWGSDPNALPEVYIRGESGIGAKQLDRSDLSKSNLIDNPNLPTFIMDGFEISVQKLYDYDPNRIESITILKDAAATALYGSRAANGVVVITTVAPKPGKINVSYSFTGEITGPDLSGYDLMNAPEKLEAERLAGSYVHNDRSINSQYELYQLYNRKLENVLEGVDNYWLSKPLKSVFNHKHSVYIDGGSDNLRFGLDLSYTNQDGVMKGSARDRLGAGFKMSYHYKGFSVENHVSFSQSKSKESPFGSFSQYAEAQPYNKYMDDEGNYLSGLPAWDRIVYPTMIVNPLYESQLSSFDRSLNEDITNNLSIMWNIGKDFLFRGQLSLRKDMGNSEKFIDPLSNKLTRTTEGQYVYDTGQLTNIMTDGFNLESTASLSYNKNVGKSSINVLAGMNLRDRTSSSVQEIFVGFPSGSLNSPNYAQRIKDKPSYDESTNRLVGFMGSLNYSLDNIYLLDASVRLDGSSAFGSNKRFAPFWSFGVGVNLHNYKFMKDNKVVNHLKIRGSYGQTGKANFPAYTARTSYISITDEWYKTGYGSVLQALGNKDLSWETTDTIDIGGEIGFLNNLIYMSGSYYNKKTRDLINDVTIPSSTGFTTYKNNIGEILNEGFELDLRITALRTKSHQLIINANMAHNKNTILKISESLKAYNDAVIKKFVDANQYKDDMTAPFIQYTEGGSLNSIWGNMSEGINPATGEEVFVTPSGTLIDSWIASNQQVLGNTDPKGQGSIGLNYSYKRFSVFISMRYEFGGQRYNTTLVDKVENIDIYNQNADRRVLTDRWTKPGDVAKYRSIIANGGGRTLTRPTSRFVQNYNELSLSSFNVSYDLPDKILKPLHLSLVRVELGMNDMFNLSSVKQERGISYPFARTFNFSVKATF